MTKLAIHSIGTGAVEGCECRYCAEPGAQDGFAREEPEGGSFLRIRSPAVVSAAQGVVDSVAEEVGAAGDHNTGTAIISVGGSRTDTWFGLTRISNADELRATGMTETGPGRYYIEVNGDRWPSQDEMCEHRYAVSLDRAAELGIPHDKLLAGVKAMLDYAEGDDAGEVAAVFRAMLGNYGIITPGLWSDRSVRELVAERDALVETNAILNRGCAAVYAEVERLRSEIAVSRDARAVALDTNGHLLEMIERQARALGESANIIADKDARIAELKSRLACEQNKPAASATPDRNGPAVAGPTNPTPGGPQAPGQPRPAPQHDPFRDFPSDRRRVGA